MNNTYSRLRKRFSVLYLFLATNRQGNQNLGGGVHQVFSCFALYYYFSNRSHVGHVDLEVTIYSPEWPCTSDLPASAS